MNRNEKRRWSRILAMILVFAMVFCDPSMSYAAEVVGEMLTAEAPATENVTEEDQAAAEAEAAQAAAESEAARLAAESEAAAKAAAESEAAAKAAAESEAAAKAAAESEAAAKAAAESEAAAKAAAESEAAAKAAAESEAAAKAAAESEAAAKAGTLVLKTEPVSTQNKGEAAKLKVTYSLSADSGMESVETRLYVPGQTISYPQFTANGETRFVDPVTGRVFDLKRDENWNLYIEYTLHRGETFEEEFQFVNPSVTAGSQNTFEVSITTRGTIPVNSSVQTTTARVTYTVWAEETEAPVETETAAETETETVSEAETETETAVETESETETETAAETEAPKTEFSYEDSRVRITATAEEGAKLPQDAQLKADYLEPGSAAYEEAVQTIEAQLGSQIGADEENVTMGYILYDIYFESSEGRIEPENGNVKVEMSFVTPAYAGDVKGEMVSSEVVHVKNDGEAEIVTDYVNTTEDGAVTSMGFTQDSFSVSGVAAAYAASDAVVDQGLVLNVGFMDRNGNLQPTAEAKSGETIKAVVSFTNSSANDDYAEEPDKNHRTARLKISDLEPYVTMLTRFEDGTKTEIHINNNNEDLILYVTYHKAEGYLDISIPAGATGSFNLEFYTENGITPGDEKAPTITLTPEILYPHENDSVSEPATGKWNADFKWNPVDKKVENVDHNEIKVDTDKNQLTGWLNYTMKAESLNRNETGAIWTDHILVEDTLTLPDGFSFPTDDKMTIDKENGTISYNGNVVFELKETQEAEIQDLTCDGKNITVKMNVPNPNKENGQVTKEMDNLDLAARLDGSWIKIPEGYKDSGDLIVNNVKIDPIPNVGSKSWPSEDTVDTTTKGPGEEFTVDKHIGDKNGEYADKDKHFKPGNKVPYTITITNTGKIPLAATDKNGNAYELTDTLPNELKLTDEQKKALETLGATVEGNKITVKPGALKVGESYTLTFEATLKDLESIKNSSTVDNTAYYRGASDHDIFEIDKPDIDIEKTGNQTTLKDGESITYTVTVSNRENTKDENEEIVVDKLPKGLFLTGVTDSDGNAIDLTDPANWGKQYKDVKLDNKTVTIGVDGEGRATITWKAGQLEANTDIELNYTCIFDASKADKNNIKDGKITVSNKATLNSNGKSDGHDFSGEVGKLGVEKEVTGAVDEDGNAVTGTFEKDVKVTYKITVSNDKDNPYKEDVYPEDTLPKGMFPIGLKAADGTEIKTKEELLAKIGQWNWTKMTLDGDDVEVQIGNDQVRIKWHVPVLAAGETKTITYTAQLTIEDTGITGSGTQKLINTVKVPGDSDNAEIEIKVKGVENDKKILLADGTTEVNTIELQGDDEVTTFLPFL